MGLRMAGKRVVVVGAGQAPGETVGNGRAIALLMAREGAHVLCVDRDGERAEETAALIGAEGGAASAFAADIVDEAAGEIILAETEQRLGGLDVLVNNVGVASANGKADGPAHIVERATFEAILTINLTAMWATIRAAIPRMRAGGGGSIVNISSLAALGGNTLVAYEVSKAAVNRLTSSVALSNAAYGVRCNAVAPGLLETPMGLGGGVGTHGRDAETRRALRDRLVPLRGRMGEAWDTAYAVLYLASDEARFVTGVVLPVDGGGSAKIG